MTRGGGLPATPQRPGAGAAPPQGARLYDSAGRWRGGLPASLPEHVREALEDQILSGELPPGERITEEGLADSLGVSRTPVREALLTVEAQGLIVRRRGRGIYVANLTTAGEARTLYRIRAAVEPYLAGRAAERADADLMATLAELQSAYRAVVAAADAELDLAAVIRLDSDMHWTIYHHADSDLTSVVAQYWGRIQRELYTRVYRAEYPKLLASQHDHILEALAACDAERAVAATEQHIWSGWESLRGSFDEA
jgi:DNA-binding GntR family transcriptional regulator